MLKERRANFSVCSVYSVVKWFVGVRKLTPTYNC